MKPFLYLPFKKQNYQITEGWIYSEEERKIHSFLGHSGIDFALSRGTEIFAPADGIAIASYFSRPLMGKNGKYVLYKKKQVWFGLGYFVQIYHSEYDLFTAYAHLCKIEAPIKVHAPRKMGRFFIPVGHKVLPEKLEQYKFAARVKKGDLIGYSGDSGLGWGSEDYPPTRLNFKKYISWDEPHLHFEVFIREGSRRTKKHFDPYGIKNESSYYPDSFRIQNRGNMGKKGEILWVLDKEGMPEFIK